MGPPYVEPVSDPLQLVPEEGGDTMLRGSPEDCLSTCIADGSLLNSLAAENGWEELTFSDISYRKNDTVDPAWVWNITIAGPPSDGISKAVEFMVSVEGGGILDRKRLTLVSEKERQIFRYPDPEREMISLAEGEKGLKRSVHGDSYFRGEEYSSTYRLDIISRGNTCSNARSIVFMNILGIDRADISDLHISRVMDRSDPSRMYLTVLDAANGEIVSETELEGAGISLLNAYGFDLA
jgi:hypothetical protein